MEANARLSKGTRRHIRNAKAAIRRQFDDSPEAREKVRALIAKFYHNTKELEIKKKDTRGETKTVDVSGAVKKPKRAKK